MGSRTTLPRHRDPDDSFGTVLVAGNFNGDTRDGRPVDDLAIGIPFEDIPGMGEVPCSSRGGGVPLGARSDLMCPAPGIVDAGAVQGTDGFAERALR